MKNENEKNKVINIYNDNLNNNTSKKVDISKSSVPKTIILSRIIANIGSSLVGAR